jgi:hypothetical protein
MFLGFWSDFLHLSKLNKYDFNITKDCCEKNMALICWISKNNNLKSLEFYNWFQQVAKNITAFLKFYTSICNNL